MQVVANGDERMVMEMFKHTTTEHVNAVSFGVFLNQRTACPVDGVSFKGVSVLDIAAIAPRDDDVAYRMVNMLIDANADPNECQSASRPSSLLHRLACCRWTMLDDNDKAETGFLMSSDRMHKIARVLQPEGDGDEDEDDEDVKQMKFQRAGALLSKKSSAFIGGPSRKAELSPLQLGAMCGNEDFLIHYISRVVRHSWEWGRQSEVRIPLDCIDCGTSETTDISVLELLLVYKYRDILRMKLFYRLLIPKWEKFGMKSVRLKFVSMLTLAVLLTLGCLPETRPFGQFFVRLAVLVFASLILVWQVSAFIILRNSGMYQRMRLIGTHARLGLDDSGVYIFPSVAFLSIIVVLLHDFELFIEKQHWDPFLRHTRLVMLDMVSSFLIWLVWLSMVFLLRFFKRTFVLVSGLATIIKYDLAGWFTVYMGMCIATAGGIRIASWHYTDKKDQVQGSFFKMFMTLEEATHGPDVQWRAMVMSQSFMAAFFFLFFLWTVTIIMFNLLIAMFSNTFDKRKKLANEELYYQRAVEVIIIEKTTPAWMHKMLGWKVGATSGVDKEADPSLSPREADEETPLIQGLPQPSTTHWLTLAQDDSMRWQDKISVA